MPSGRISLTLEWGETKSMSEDWVSGYMQNDDREREAELRRARFVEAGAVVLFKELWKQVNGDLAKFHAVP